MSKFRFRLNDEEEWPDDEEELLDEEGVDIGELEVEGPSYSPVFTGLYHADGTPIIRHPVVMRMGFHTEERKYYCPTLEENQFGEGSGKIHGWMYE